jgi:hypothetical protein
MYEDEQEDPAGMDGEDRLAGGPPLAVRDLGNDMAPPLAVKGANPFLDARRASLQALYDEGSKRLTSTYRNSARNELLLALGAALMKPTTGGTFGESLSNVPEALLGYTQGRRQRDEAQQTALLKLMSQYDVASARSASPTTMQREYEYLLRIDRTGKLAAQYLAAKANPQMAVQGVDAYGRPTVTYMDRNAGGNVDTPGGSPPAQTYDPGDVQWEGQ